MPHADHDRALDETWRVTFHHSAGLLGSHALTMLRDEGRILGWRRAEGEVLYPARDLGGDGDWVELGPGAVLLSVVPDSRNGGSVLARVRLDGASCGMFGRLAAPVEGLAKGTPLIARIDTSADITFHPDMASS